MCIELYGLESTRSRGRAQSMGSTSGECAFFLFLHRSYNPQETWGFFPEVNDDIFCCSASGKRLILMAIENVGTEG